MPGNLLSICIPTYNFGMFIGKTLDSIIANLADGVEVVILDGGSTDATGRIVAQRQERFPQITYHRQEFRGGIDRDIAKVISLANGKYCWLFSADDIMKPDAVKKVLGSIQSDCDIYLCEEMLCDYEMRPLREHPIFQGIAAKEIFNLGNIEQRRRYFSHAKTSEAFFSFLAGPIVRRIVWERGDGIPESFYHTGWGLAGRLLSLVPHGLIVQYLGETLIHKRGGNDSFREHGTVNRMRMSVEGFSHIAETIFGADAPETFHIRRVVRNEWTLPIILSIKLLAHNSPASEDSEMLRKVVAKHYLNAGFINLGRYLIYLLTPISFMELSKKLIRQLKKLKRVITHSIRI